MQYEHIVDKRQRILRQVNEYIFLARKIDDLDTEDDYTDLEEVIDKILLDNPSGAVPTAVPVVFGEI